MAAGRVFFMWLNQTNNKKGFTLIEVVIYVGLFSFVIAGALVSFHAILSSSTRSLTKAMVQEEGSFLLGKIDWVLSGAESADVSADGSTLSVIKFDDSAGNPLVISVGSGEMSFSREGNPEEIISNSNVSLDCPNPCFLRTGGGSNPESISANFTLSAKTSAGLQFSQSFSTIKY